MLCVRACVTAVTSDPERGNRITQKRRYAYDRRIQDPGFLFPTRPCRMRRS